MLSRLPQTVYLSADDVIRLVRQVGLPRCIAGVAERIERDFLRWTEFDKSARVACHSREGVIELMPIADSREFAFKYVNRHPKNTRSGRQLDRALARTLAMQPAVRTARSRQVRLPTS